MKKQRIPNLKSNRSSIHEGINPKDPLVAIASPSTRLLDDLKDTKSILDSFGVRNEITIVAAHRSPKKTLRYIQQLEDKGVDVIIAAGNGSAHLPGMDALLSIIQMPPGVPVGTMGINSSYNAGIFACQILSPKYPYLKEKIKAYKEALEQEVEAEDLELKNG